MLAALFLAGVATWATVEALARVAARVVVERKHHR